MRALDALRMPALAALAMIAVGCATKPSPEENAGPIPGDQAVARDVVSTTPAADTLAPPAPTRPAPVIDDGLRLPGNLLALPSDRELQKPATPAPAPEGGGVTARPPVSD